MPAFTYLGSKVNISLAHSTMTIHSKDGNSLFIALAPFVARNVPVATCIVRDDKEHDFYHDDSFDLDNAHYHLKFAFKMTEDKLFDVLSVLIDQNFLTEEEKLDFVRTFKIVNDAALARFDSELLKLKLKAKELTDKAVVDPATYQGAAVAANQLYQRVSSEADIYMKNQNPQSYKHFKEECKAAIDAARDILEEHRGYKNIFCNIAAAIAGLGIFYLLAATINYYQTSGKHFFFQFNTDSINRMECFQEAQQGLLRV